MFAPDGSLGDIPYERMHDAVQAGAVPAVKMKAPDGSIGYVPAPKSQDAVKAGGSIVPLGADDLGASRPGVTETLWNDLKGMVGGIPQAVKTVGEMTQPASAGVAVAPMAESLANADQQRKTEGRSLPYRADAAAATLLGANVPGMEEAAKEGNPSAVVGHAIAGAAPYVAGAGIGAAADKLGPLADESAQDTAERLYQSALKPSTTLAPSKVQAAIQAGLENKIPVSDAGAEKIASLVDDLNDKIKATIATDPTRPINKFQVASRLGDTAQRFSNQVNPDADLEAIGNAGNEFLRTQPGEIPAEDAQALKTGTYQQLKGKSFGELKSATIEAQKSLARGLKEELNTAFPELQNLNAQETQLFGLEPLIEKALQRGGNTQLIGIGTPVVGAAARVATGSGSAAFAAGVLKHVVDNPLVKSRLAIALSHSGIAPATAFARVAAYSGALGQAVSDAKNAPRADQTSE
jgi:hypothetical protein